MNPKAILTVMAVALFQILSPQVFAGPSGLYGQVRLERPPGEALIVFAQSSIRGTPIAPALSPRQ